MEHFIRLCLVFLVFIRPFTSGLSEPSSNWFFLLVLLLIFLSHTTRLILKKQRTYSTGIDLSLFLFSLACVIGLFNSFSRNCAIASACSFLSYFLLFFLVVHYPIEHKNARFFIILSAFIVSLYGIYQSLWGFKETREFISLYNLSSEFLGRLSPKKVFSTFVYPNAFAGYLVLIIPLLFGLKKRFFILSLPILYAFYLTGSRGGFISFFFSLFLLFVLRKKRLLMIVSLLLFLLAIFHYCIPVPSSLKARFGYAKASCKIIRDNPFGTGLETFKDMYFKYKLQGDEETRMAHNNYLQIGVELGILGLISFLLIVIFISLKGYLLVSKNPYLEGYYIGSLTFFFHSLVDFDLYVPEITFCLFFFIGMLFSPERKEKRESKIFPYLMIVPMIFLCLYCFKMMKASCAYERAMDYIFTNEYSLAEIKLEEAVRLNKNPEWLILLGRMKERNDAKEALRLYRMAQEENPNCAYYNFTLGRLLIKMGRKEEAIFFLKRALELYPTNPVYKLLIPVRAHPTP